MPMAAARLFLMVSMVITVRSIIHAKITTVSSGITVQRLYDMAVDTIEGIARFIMEAVTTAVAQGIFTGRKEGYITKTVHHVP